MKTVYVNKEVFKEAMDYLNRDITFYDFLSHSKALLKQLLSDPINADIDSYLKDNGLTKQQLIATMIDKGIIEKETKITESKQLNESDKFTVSYKIPKRNFERKM
jgi:hypothetical protein